MPERSEGMGGAAVALAVAAMLAFLLMGAIGFLLYRQTLVARQQALIATEMRARDAQAKAQAFLAQQQAQMQPETQKASLEAQKKRKQVLPPVVDPLIVDSDDDVTSESVTNEDAELLFASALVDAEQNNNHIIIQLGAPGCSWCKVLESFFETNQALFAEDYEILKLCTETMKNGEAVAGRLRSDTSGGIPWMAILDSSGQELITSDGPNGNIGYPVMPAEIDHFMNMLRITRKKLSDDQLQQIASALEENAKQYR